MVIYSEQVIELVWRKGQVVPGYNPSQWRKDFAGAWINRNAYGMQGDYGWGIDHKRPLSKGGEESISNLIPCQWLNNVAKGNSFPEFKSKITSKGERNVKSARVWIIN